MRTRRRTKLLLLLLAIGVGVALRERRTSSQIQVASFPAMSPPAPTSPPATADDAARSKAGGDGDDDLSQPFTVAPSGPGDDLTRIKGIGPKLESLLHDQGITTFAQLAALSDEDVDRLDARLVQFTGRIRRDEWVAQASDLVGD